MSLVNDISILFIFAKKQLLVLLIFVIAFFVSIYFISALIFMISFLLLPLAFFVLLSLIALGISLVFFICDVSCFLMKDCIAINFPLRTAFAASHWFWVVVFSLSFVSRYLFISSLISSVISWLFSSVVFSLHVFVFFTEFFP